MWLEEGNANSYLHFRKAESKIGSGNDPLLKGCLYIRYYHLAWAEFHENLPEGNWPQVYSLALCFKAWLAELTIPRNEITSLKGLCFRVEIPSYCIMRTKEKLLCVGTEATPSILYWVEREEEWMQLHFLSCTFF